MQDSFIQSKGDKLIVDQNQLTMYAITALVIVVLIALVIFANKRRKKDFIKTLPTNLKDGE